MADKKNQATFQLTGPVTARRIESVCADRHAAIQAGLQQLNAGEYIPFEDIQAWVDAWDTARESPPPRSRS